MGKVHPLAVTQEQILRAAFFAHLPGEIRAVLGTADAGVHPERPTPSANYVFKGTRGVGMRARYDLGFGHPTDSAGIAGVGELKAGRDPSRRKANRATCRSLCHRYVAVETDHPN
jgi:hypothetical protein